MRRIQINKPILGDEELHAVLQVLKSEILTNKGCNGPFVSKFEKEFAKFIGAKHAVALNSGTAALHTALLAAKIGNNDEVIVPSFAFVAAAEAVCLTGAEPVFIDIDPHTYTLNSRLLEEAISKKTRAIIPVHLYGLAADMDLIMEIANKYDLVVIEDAAQAHGAEYHGRKVGSIGHFGCFSFYASKNMTTGEGGMVTTNDDDYAYAARLIRDHGEEDLQSVRLGHNYRMPEIEAAIGVCQLAKLPGFLKARKKNAEILLSELGSLSELSLPIEPKGYRHAWYVCTVRLVDAKADKRNILVKKMNEAGIDVRVYYPSPIHLMPYYSSMIEYRAIRLTESEEAANQVFSLPVHPGLSEEELGYAVSKLKEFLRS